MSVCDLLADSVKSLVLLISKGIHDHLFDNFRLSFRTRRTVRSRFDLRDIRWWRAIGGNRSCCFCKFPGVVQHFEEFVFMDCLSFLLVDLPAVVLNFRID